jgi:N-acetylmuramic acid 6-phosphate etherase
MSTTPQDRSHIDTEKRNPRSRGLHKRTTAELVEIISDEDRHVHLALKRARARLTRFIEAAEPGFLAGGRLTYVGAGTSGRLGVLDASEAPPTFQVPPTRVVGILAGGDASLRRSSEGAEDDGRGAWDELQRLELTARDVVIGIAAGGTTPYVLGALEFCKQPSRPLSARPLTALLACAQVDRPDTADHLVILKTGPEVITGSTRMKAGSATKAALNIISTTLMIRAGKVYDNLMVDVRATNAKLRDRAARIITQLTGLAREDAFALLDRCEGDVKTAIVAHRRGVAPEHARALLDSHARRLDAILDV